MTSLNPIAYNDGGIFRNSDFVGYIPDFLKEEPDVVTLLQVMSDYLNNAYRNIEETSEFEIRKICTETSVSTTKTELKKLQSMFELAYGRGESVLLVSSPRNNVKSDAVLGNLGAQYPLTVKYGASAVTDTIRAAKSLGVGSRCTDGQVVYVEYENITPTQTIPYYYDASSNTLIRDPKGNSQDPFEGTPNTPGRMIQFYVDNVGAVGSRFANSVGAVDYYEVFFKLKIRDVTSVSNTDTVSFDIDGFNSEEDSLIVDYCNMASIADSGKYRATIKFADDGGFAWKDGFPTGVFYFRDSSTASLVRVGSGSSILSPDPLSSKNAEHYTITGLEVNSGVVKAYVDNFPGLYSYALCYLVRRDTGYIVGHYKMDASIASTERYDDGRLYVLLTPCDGNDSSLLLGDAENIELVIIPLFQSKRVIDYTDSKPIVKWDDQYPMCGTRSIMGERLYMRRASLEGNRTVVSGFSPNTTNVIGVNSFLLDTKYECDSSNALFSGNVMWNGIAYLKSAPVRLENGKYMYTLAEGYTIRYTAGATCDILDITTGVVTVSGNDNRILNGYWKDSDLYSAGDYALLESVGTDADPVLVKMATVTGNTQFTISDSTLGADTVYTVSKVKVDSSATLDSFEYLKQYQDYTAGIVKWTNGGDIFSAEYMLAYDYEYRSESLFHMITDVVPYGIGSYSAGSYVFADGNVYRVAKDTYVETLSDISSVPGFVPDHISHYSLGLKTVENAFMPYYGQYAVLDYDEKPNYSADMSITTRPLYIAKVKDTALKYGWRDREYMMYGNRMDRTTKARNGFIELYETFADHDIVNNDLSLYASGYTSGKFIPRGTSRYISADIDAALSAVNNYDGTWTVSVRSSDHGLYDGVEVSVAGVVCDGLAGGRTYGDLVFNHEHVTVKLIDGDSFSYTVSVDADIPEDTLVGEYKNAECIYCSDYRYDITAAQVSDDGEYIYFDAENSGYIDSGTTIYVSDCAMTCDSDEDAPDIDLTGEYVSVFKSTSGSNYVAIRNTIGLPAGHHYVPVSGYARVSSTISAGDLMYDGECVYRVSDGQWQKLDLTALTTPFTIFSRHNLFETNGTNTTFGLGEEHEIHEIYGNGPGTALVNMREAIDFIRPENADIVENKTEVFIQNVFPTVYNGWHTVTKVYGPGIFEITIKDIDGELVPGSPVENTRMIAQAGTWYRYTVNACEWDKISNYATYTSANVISNIRLGSAESGEDAESVYVYTNQEQNFEVGDRIVFDVTGRGCYSVGDTVNDSTGFVSSVVRKVINGKNFVIDGDSDLVDTIHKGESTVFRGYILGSDGSTYDNIDMLYGEFSKKLHSYGNSRISFRNGDVVILLGQVTPHTNGAWRVVANGSWMPIRRKRVVKIRDISVEMYNNPEYNEYDDTTVAVPYKYRCYTEADIRAAKVDNGLYYMVPDWFARNYKFTEVALDNLDTTRDALYEYNAKYDYGTVAPRDFVDSSFKGIPDMHYPLVEKVERLSYLKDMNVIDYDFIGYLARYMGYDITALASDVDESNVYRSDDARRKAVRETIENLPQYYALGGTKAGINMLLNTFGIIADVVTKWTNTTNPYGELLTEDEMLERVESENENESITGSWVPTPHIGLYIPTNSNFKNLLMSESDIAVLKEQIRVFKPINVVFDDIVMSTKVKFEMTASISGGNMKLGSSSAPVLTDTAEDEVVTIDYGTCSGMNCVF